MTPQKAIKILMDWQITHYTDKEMEAAIAEAVKALTRQIPVKATTEQRAGGLTAKGRWCPACGQNLFEEKGRISND